MSLRNRTERVLSSGGWPRVVLWAIAPVLCFLLPGVGAILAFAWVVALMGFGRQPVALLGLARPAKWRKIIGYALVVAALVSLLSDYAFEPVAEWLARRPLDTSQFQAIPGNWPKLAFFLVASWLIGALVEETVFRGFLIGYGTTVFGERFKWPLALFSSMAFGFAHLYQGAAGVLLTGAVGFTLAMTYIFSQKSLPFVMLIHGFIDTIGIVALFLGVQRAH
jgi:membrane protease YdiL (CAAX protease family)